MRSPGAAHNLLLAKQAFGNFTITMSLQPRVEGADRQNEPPATLARKRERRSGQTTAFNRRQEAMCRPQTNIKLASRRSSTANSEPPSGILGRQTRWRAPP